MPPGTHQGFIPSNSKNKMLSSPKIHLLRASACRFRLNGRLAFPLCHKLPFGAKKGKKQFRIFCQANIVFICFPFFSFILKTHLLKKNLNEISGKFLGNERSNARKFMPIWPCRLASLSPPLPLSNPSLFQQPPKCPQAVKQSLPNTIGGRAGRVPPRPSQRPGP